MSFGPIRWKFKSIIPVQRWERGDCIIALAASVSFTGSFILNKTDRTKWMSPASNQVIFKWIRPFKVGYIYTKCPCFWSFKRFEWNGSSPACDFVWAWRTVVSLLMRAYNNYYRGSKLSNQVKLIDVTNELLGHSRANTILPWSAASWNLTLI